MYVQLADKDNAFSYKIMYGDRGIPTAVAWMTGRHKELATRYSQVMFTDGKWGGNNKCVARVMVVPGCRHSLSEQPNVIINAIFAILHHAESAGRSWRCVSLRRRWRCSPSSTRLLPLRVTAPTGIAILLHAVIGNNTINLPNSGPFVLPLY